METIEEVLAEASEVFGYDRERRYQERAHAYLERRKVSRSYSDTAIERVVLDLVGRAHRAGGSGELAAVEGERDALRAALSEVAEITAIALDGAGD